MNTAPCTSVNSSFTRFTVPIANANGFQPGLTVTAYSTTSPFNTQAVNLVVTAISGNVLTLQIVTTSGVTGDAFCSNATAAGTLVFEAEQIGIPVPTPSMASLTAGTAITLQQTNGASTTGTVYPGLSNSAITAGNTVFLSDAQGIASVLANCVISRTRTGTSNSVSALAVQAGNCEPGLDFLGAQTHVTIH